MRKLICFDLDNTLVYSDEAHILAYNEALLKFKMKKKPKKFLKKLFGRPHSEIAKILIPTADKELSKKFLYEHDKILIKKTLKHIKSIPNVNKTLKELKKDYDLAVLSNCTKSTIISTLKYAKINLKLFKIIIGNDDVKRSKPFPDEILKAEKLDCNKAEFMVGDSIYDIIAGKRAKVKTIAVLTGNYSRSRLKKYHPNFILKNVNEILKILKK